MDRVVRNRVRAGGCADLPRTGEPGRPMTGMNLVEAEAYCVFRGGRLPTEESGPGPREALRDTSVRSAAMEPWGLRDGPYGFGSNGTGARWRTPRWPEPEGAFSIYRERRHVGSLGTRRKWPRRWVSGLGSRNLATRLGRASGFTRTAPSADRRTLCLFLEPAPVITSPTPWRPPSSA